MTEEKNIVQMPEAQKPIEAKNLEPSGPIPLTTVEVTAFRALFEDQRKNKELINRVVAETAMLHGFPGYEMQVDTVKGFAYFIPPKEIKQ